MFDDVVGGVGEEADSTTTLMILVMMLVTMLVPMAVMIVLMTMTVMLMTATPSAPKPPKPYTPNPVYEPYASRPGLAVGKRSSTLKTRALSPEPHNPLKPPVFKRHWHLGTLAAT